MGTTNSDIILQLKENLTWSIGCGLLTTGSRVTTGHEKSDILARWPTDIGYRVNYS